MFHRLLQRVDERLGGREGLESLSRTLRRRGMGLLLDIVPNHMAMSSQNPWWMDVLEHGRASGTNRTSVGAFIN